MAALIWMIVMGAVLVPLAPSTNAMGPAAHGRLPMRAAIRSGRAVSPLSGGWKRLDVHVPQPVVGASLAWDGADRVMFQFGGRTAGGESDALWTYRPTTTRAGRAGWTYLRADGDWPAARSGASLVWDAHDRVLLLYAGTSSSEETNDLWAYRPGRGGTAAGRWANVTPAASPLRRASHAAVWDDGNGQMLVYGGDSNGMLLGDTWRYIPAHGGMRAGSWFHVSAPGPSARRGAVMVWDARDRVALLAGGLGYSGLLSDLWAFQPRIHGASMWHRLSTATPLGGRMTAAGAWDAANGRMLVFGGAGARVMPVPTATRPATVTPTRTRQPTNTPPPTSTPVPTATPIPTNTPVPTSTATATPAPTNAPTITPSPAPSSTATASVQPTAPPPAIAAMAGGGAVAPVATAGMAPLAPVLPARRIARPATSLPLTTIAPHDALTRAAVSGEALPPGPVDYRDDLWSYVPGHGGVAPGRWRPLRSDGPSARVSAAVYDTEDRQLLLAGGQSVSSLLGDIWSYAVRGRLAGRWSLLNGGVPQARSGQAGAWDARDRALFIFGGYSGTWLNDLWVYRPAAGAVGRWTALTTASAPPARTDASLVWDSADSVLLLFGGSDARGPRSDAWAYRPGGNGTAIGRWISLSTTSDPTGRRLHAAVWDDRDRAMLVYGGETNTTVLRDLWSLRVVSSRVWRGRWTLLASTTPLPPRLAHAAVWDPRRARMLVFGGVGVGGNFLGDLWAYRPRVGGAAGFWTPLGTSIAPDARAAAAVTWDLLDDAMLLFGGTGPASIRNDTYAYRPTTGWMRLNQARGPDRRNGSTAVVDTVNRALLIYGGAGAAGASNDLWQLGGPHTPPPAR